MSPTPTMRQIKTQPLAKWATRVWQFSGRIHITSFHLMVPNSETCQGGRSGGGKKSEEVIVSGLAR